MFCCEIELDVSDYKVFFRDVGWSAACVINADREVCTAKPEISDLIWETLYLDILDQEEI